MEPSELAHRLFKKDNQKFPTEKELAEMIVYAYTNLSQNNSEDYLKSRLLLAFANPDYEEAIDETTTESIFAKQNETYILATNAFQKMVENLGITNDVKQLEEQSLSVIQYIIEHLGRDDKEVQLFLMQYVDKLPFLTIDISKKELLAKQRERILESEHEDGEKYPQSEIDIFQELYIGDDDKLPKFAGLLIKYPKIFEMVKTGQIRILELKHIISYL